MIAAAVNGPPEAAAVRSTETGWPSMAEAVMVVTVGALPTTWMVAVAGADVPPGPTATYWKVSVP